MAVDRAQLIGDVRSNLAGLRHGNLGIPLLLLVMLAMVMLPIPPFLLDVLFTFSIALSIVVLLVAVVALSAVIFLKKPSGPPAMSDQQRTAEIKHAQDYEREHNLGRARSCLRAFSQAECEARGHKYEK